jgi:hypothetical protein
MKVKSSNLTCFTDFTEFHEILQMKSHKKEEI